MKEMYNLINIHPKLTTLHVKLRFEFCEKYRFFIMAVLRQVFFPAIQTHIKSLEVTEKSNHSNAKINSLGLHRQKREIRNWSIQICQYF